MTRRNRVTPEGAIEALEFRGLFMGNRGVLHDDAREVVTPWTLKAWLICRTSFKERCRALMSRGHYTELFFLDEVHALAAGHRPCFECRREAARAFVEAAGHEGVRSLDEALHAERLTGRPGMRRADRRKRTHDVPAGDVPVGAMVRVGRTAFARFAEGFVAWSEEAPWAYLDALTGRARRDADTLWASLRSGAPLAMLTPPTAARALRRGYAPVRHPSADTAARIEM